MTPTEVFKLFLKNGVTPNERLALMTEIRINVRNKQNEYLWRKRFFDEKKEVHEIENTFAERIMYNTVNTVNHLGKYGESSYCTSLSSFMRYLLYYMPSIIGTTKKKNRYLERENAEIPSKIGYKRYWTLRLIKKWHEFIKGNISNYNRYLSPWDALSYNKWKLTKTKE